MCEWDELYGNPWAKIDGCHDTITFHKDKNTFTYVYITDHCGFIDKYVYFGKYSINTESKYITFTFTNMERDEEQFSINERIMKTSFTEKDDHVEFLESPRSPFWKKPMPTIYYFKLYGESQVDEYFKIPVP